MIKKFSSYDFQACCELFVKVFNGVPWNDKWTNETAKIYLQELVDNKRFLGYTLWKNDSLIGAVFCHMKNHYRGEEIFVDEMYISAEYQRRGYGMELMNAVEKFAKEQNFISITLLTGMDKPAFPFYQKFGCKHLEYLAFMYKRIR